METTPDMRTDFTTIIDAARRISAPLGDEVESVLTVGRERPLPRAEIARLLTAVVEVLRRSASRRGDEQTGKALDDVNCVVDLVLGVRERIVAVSSQSNRIALVERNGIPPGRVSPRPCFHGIEVAMNCGFVKTTDIQLWDANERLEIHLGQFQQQHGRKPTGAELIDIMLSKMKLPGIPIGESTDQFEIVQLARSIAVNGVRKPPIIDTDGTLLDGNRRVAACHYILNSDDFEADDKKRVEYIFVWQLTEHATNDERNAVVVSLNFEPDCKQDWPAYVKARKLYLEWQAMLALEPRAPGSQRQTVLKRSLAKKFALEMNTVSRYLKMIEWSNDFEDFHLTRKQRDNFEVKHRANHYFQYFDELQKGTSRGVAYALDQDESLKHLVFDLLYDGKFRNWSQVRYLKHIPGNEDARAALVRAREESDTDTAQEFVDDGIAIARNRSAEERQLGVNSRIESFVDWLEALPVSAFRDRINAPNLQRLLKALRLVEAHVSANLGSTGTEQ